MTAAARCPVVHFDHNSPEQAADSIDFYCGWFVDQVIGRGECDVTEVIGVPSIVTVDWPGLPVDGWRRFASAHRATLAHPRGSAEWTHAVEVDLPFLPEQMRATIAARRRQPGDDAISFLCAQTVDGRPLTEDEVFSIVDLLVAGGTVTTSNLVSQALARTVTRDVEFHGCSLTKGDRVLLVWASANRDPAGGFDRPDELDIERWPNRHTSFGIGIHRCAGSHIGRAIAKRLLTEVLRRMPDYEIDLDGVVPYASQGAHSGYARVPARFPAGARVLPRDAAVPPPG